MNKPVIICHMASTVDGKILTAHWENEEWAKNFKDLYEKYHQSFNSNAWILGRVSMEKDFSGGAKPELIEPDQPISRKPFIGNKEATSFAIAVDGK
jgi:hypothetical protein